MSYEPRPVCIACWNQYHPARPAPAGLTDEAGNVEPEPCAFCEKTTTAGIFVRLKPPAPDPEPVACPRCGQPALKYRVAMGGQGEVTVIGCQCVPKGGAPMLVDAPLTGPRIPRFVKLDSPEASERIRRVAEAFRERWPHPQDALHRAQKLAVEMERLRETGLSEADRVELAEWLEQVAKPRDAGR